MRPSESDLLRELSQIELGTAHINVYSNYLGKVYPRKKGHIRQCISRQFSNPIKWEQIMQLLYRRHQVSNLLIRIRSITIFRTTSFQYSTNWVPVNNSARLCFEQAKKHMRNTSIFLVNRLIHCYLLFHY